MIILTPQDPSDFQYSMAVTQDREARLDAAVRRVACPVAGIIGVSTPCLLANWLQWGLEPREIVDIRKEFARG